MVNLLASAVAAASGLFASPAARRLALQAAQKATDAFKSVSLGAIQQCRLWKRNRGIRVLYNARKRVLDAEIQALRAAGASRQAMAQHAYEFRRQERLIARQHMRENGDAKSVELLEKRDAKKYGGRGIGDKDGPNFEGLKQDAAGKLVASSVENRRRMRCSSTSSPRRPELILKSI